MVEGVLGNLSDRQHIDDVLRQWPYESGHLSARMVTGEDGRDVIQIRIDMGVMQLEVDGRPDGYRPGGAESYYDYLVSLAIQHGDDFVLTDEQCAEIDREFIQFYHRRIAWLGLREYQRAAEDAQHTLGLMDLCHRYSPDEQWTLSHEQYRPFVLFHLTQARAMWKVEEGGAEAAIHELNEGLSRFRAMYAEYDAEEQFEEDELAGRLIDLRETMREEHQVGRTLQERLADAVAAEQYELAARIRDEITRRQASP